MSECDQQLHSIIASILRNDAMYKEREVLLMLTMCTQSESVNNLHTRFREEKKTFDISLFIQVKTVILFSRMVVFVDNCSKTFTIMHSFFRRD